MSQRPHTIEEFNKLSINDRNVIFGTPENNDFELQMSKKRASMGALKYPEIYDNKILCDLGCGYGDGLFFVVNNFNCQNGIGIDANTEALKIANERSKNEKIEYINESIMDTKLPNQSIDIINCVETIEHVDIEGRDKLLKECIRILKDDGYLFITTPELRGNKNEFPKGSHFTEYQFWELVDIVSKYGFKYIYGWKPDQIDGVSNAFLFQLTQEKDENEKNKNSNSSTNN